VPGPCRPRPVLELEERYADLDLGLVDCAIVVIAGRPRTHRLLTFDERHFRSVRPLDGGSFVLPPADS
jgi:predicted nucleic acid-binding protein